MAAAAGSGGADAAAAALAPEEAAVYDRQLRVWGVEVQRKLTAARVLLVGFGQLAAEVAKNITLAGVGHVALLDDGPAAAHAGHNFLITPAGAEGRTAAEAAAASLQAMNPLVKVSAAPGSTADVAAGGGGAAGLLQQQDLVIATGLAPLQVEQLDAACRAAGTGFMAACAAGPAGWYFADLGRHCFTPKGCKEQQVLRYGSFAEAMAVPPEQLAAGTTHPLYRVLQACLATERQLQRRLAAADLPAAQAALARSTAAAGLHADAAAQLLAAVVEGAPEFAPVAAVLGGVIANNVVAAVSGSDEPLHNLLLYSLFDSRATVETRGCDAGAGEPGGAAGAGQQPAAEAIDIDDD